MREGDFQYVYKRFKAIILREWRFILFTAVLSAVLLSVFNLLFRKPPPYEAKVHMMIEPQGKEISLLSQQIERRYQSTAQMVFNTFTIKSRFPEFYRGLVDTSLMYEVVEGRVRGVKSLKPGTYTEDSLHAVVCPCSKRFKVVVYDTLSLWKRLSKLKLSIVSQGEDVFSADRPVFFTISYISYDRRWAERAVEKVADWLRDIRLKEKKNQLERQKKTIERLMDYYRRQIDFLADEIQRFKKGMRYPEFTEESILSLMAETNTSLNRIKKLLEFVSNHPTDTAFIDVGNKTLNDIQRERINLILTFWDLREKYGDEHPQVKSVRSQIDRINALLVRSAKDNTKYLQEQLNYYKSILPEVLEEQAMLLTIRRNLENAEDFYIALGQKLNDTEVQMGSLVSDVHILASPVVKKVGIYTRTRVVALMGFLIGLIVAVGIAILRDITTDIVLDEDTLPFPKEKVIIMPKFSGADLLPVDMIKLKEVDSSSPALNEFRKLLFKLNMFENLKEVVAITSTQTGEGKTFVSVNLASAAAISGIPILLIDGDIRAKGLSYLLGLGDVKGYSDGHYEPYRIHERLYVLPVGSAREDHLLLFNEMLSNIGPLAEKFLIILDLPPITVAPEIKLLEKFAVKYVLVLKYNYTKRSFLKMVDITPDLVVFNQKGRTSGYYRKYYRRRRRGLRDILRGFLKR